VLNRVREQLVKPVVDALDLERLPEVASRVEQQLSRLSLAPQIVLDPLVVGKNIVRRLHRHVFSVELCGIGEKAARGSAKRRDAHSKVRVLSKRRSGISGSTPSPFVTQT
jgi:hypothetical protein